MKLNKRANVPAGYYTAEREDGTHFSVVNFGTTMRTHPLPNGIYRGWEAIKITDKGLSGEDKDFYRAKTWKELEKLLTNRL